MALWRIAMAGVGVTLALWIVWASFEGAIFEEGPAILALPWGAVTFVDLYAGFLVAASAIVVLEPNRALGVALAASVFVLGNVVTLAWVVWRAPMLMARLRGDQPKA